MQLLRKDLCLRTTSGSIMETKLLIQLNVTQNISGKLLILRPRGMLVLK